MREMGIAYSITRQYDEQDGDRVQDDCSKSASSSDVEKSELLDDAAGTGIANSASLRNDLDVDRKHESIQHLQREIRHSRESLVAFSKHRDKTQEKLLQMCKENSAIVKRILAAAHSDKYTVPRQHNVSSRISTHVPSVGQTRRVQYVHIHIK